MSSNENSPKMSSAKRDKRMKSGTGGRLVFLRDDSGIEKIPFEDEKERNGSGSGVSHSKTGSASSSSLNRHVRAQTAVRHRADLEQHTRSRTSLGKFSERGFAAENLSNSFNSSTSKSRRHIKSALRPLKKDTEPDSSYKNVHFEDDRSKGKQYSRLTTLPKIKVAFADGTANAVSPSQKNYVDINCNSTESSDKNIDGINTFPDSKEDKQYASQSMVATQTNSIASRHPLLTDLTATGFVKSPALVNSETDQLSQLGKDRFSSEKDKDSEVDGETRAKLQMIFWLNQKRAREEKEKVEKEQNAKDKKEKARKLFYYGIWKVRWVIRFKIIMKNLSASKTTQSATEAHWHATNTVKEDLDQPLIFNKLFFAKDRAYDRVPFWAQEVLKKDPEERTDIECRRIHVLLRGLKGMNRFTERIQLYMCKTAWYQSIDPQRVVLRNGHVGQQFYIIYSGSVFVNLDDKTLTGERIVRTEAILGRGESFGEQSLLRNVLRTATISCREWCEFVVVEKDVFAEVCPKIFDEELAEKVEFVKQQMMFKTKWWREDDVKNLCFEAQIQEYKTNKVIVSNNLEDEWIYICMEGKCRVIKCLMLDEDIHRREYEHVEVKELPLLEWEEDLPAHRRKSKQDQEETKEQRMQRDKSRLLNSMGLKFMNEEKESGPKIIAQDNNSILKKTLEGGVVSLDTLILQKQRETKGREFIYLEIATLNPDEVFDMFTILRPPDPRLKKQSSLLLVSSGAKLLRIRRAAFFKLAAEEAIDYALTVAAIDKYPSDVELLESYSDKASWDGYKQQVIDDVVTPLRQQARRSYVNEYMDVMNDAKRKQNIRLLSTLRRKEKKGRSGTTPTVTSEEYMRRRSSVYSKDSRLQIEEVDEEQEIQAVHESNSTE